MTAEELREAEIAHRTAVGWAVSRLDRRDTLIRKAIADGWTHSQIADATGLTRGRIGQIAMESADHH